jgi:ubiquinone/menaquinone biosynthesis C-methylase UbiE
MEEDEMIDERRPGGDCAYVLDNAGQQAAARFDALSAMFDPGTIRHLESCGIGPGWHCLEVGGGGGSIAAWLSNRVGRTGRVLVTDIDPRHLESLKFPNLEVRRHNIVRDPLPEASFDLVHSRLVLLHLPEREKALARMVAALKPGGWLVDEEFDSSLSPDPAADPEEVLSKTHIAMTRVMASRGVDRVFGRHLFGRLRAHGLENVSSEGRSFMWQGGSPGASLLRSNYEQLRGAMIEAGYVTPQEFEKDIAQLQDPSFVAPSPILWTASGRRPSV